MPWAQLLQASTLVMRQEFDRYALACRRAAAALVAGQWIRSFRSAPKRTIGGRSAVVRCYFWWQPGVLAPAPRVPDRSDDAL